MPNFAGLVVADPTSTSLRDHFPLIHDWRAQAIVLACCVGILLIGSELLMRWFVANFVDQSTSRGSSPLAPNAANPSSPTDEAGVGRVIGKCENALVFIMVMLGAHDGLGLVLAAKSIARLDAMRKNPSYYLGGTLVNFVWSLSIALATRLVVFGPP